VAIIIVVVVLIIAALAIFLTATIRALFAINRGLDRTIASVGEIVSKTAPVNGVLDAINGTLVVGRDLLEGLFLQKAGADAAGLVESAFPGEGSRFLARVRRSRHGPADRGDLSPRRGHPRRPTWQPGAGSGRRRPGTGRQPEAGSLLRRSGRRRPPDETPSAPGPHVGPRRPAMGARPQGVTRKPLSRLAASGVTRRAALPLGRPRNERLELRRRQRRAA